MKGPFTLGIDVGTSATKVLLLDNSSKWVMSSWPTSEGLWNNLQNWLSGRGESVVRVGITGHGPSAIVIRNGEIIGSKISWFDDTLDGCEREIVNDHILTRSRAWVPSRLAQWEKENGPIGDGVPVQLKDLLNWELTGVIGRDTRSMRGYSGEGNFFLPDEVIGMVNTAGSKISGICIGAEVICGCDDLTAGVIGLNPKRGDLFNLANTSEHVGLVGGQPMEGLSWLPQIGKLPALSYLSTSTGGSTLAKKFDVQPSAEAVKNFISQLENEKSSEINNNINGPAWEAIKELNQPIEQVRNMFPSHEMVIGGGLALIPQIVESRGAILRAGQEVSVLGVARLAQSPLAVIFGAGKVGRGFLGQLLLRAGWRIHFVDSNVELVKALENSNYAISNLATGEVDIISEYTVSKDSWKLEEASLILTSLGANGLANWAQSVCDFDRDIDIILAENHPAPAKLVREHISSSKVGVAQAQVLRSCIEPTEQQVVDFGPLTVQVQDHWTLPLDADALTRPELVSSVPGFEAKPNFAVELTRKLYTYNAINAAVCYIGAKRGYVWLSDAANDSDIADLAARVGIESSAALIAEFGFDEGEQKDWSSRALGKYQDVTIRDPIERNARDPIRKLGLHDRILGPLHLCIKHGLPHDALVQTMKSALRYREPSDSAAIQLGLYVDDFGVWGALQKIAVGLDDSLVNYLG